MLARARPDCYARKRPILPLQAVYCTMQKTVALPTAPPTLDQAVRWIAQPGGTGGVTLLDRWRYAPRRPEEAFRTRRTHTCIGVRAPVG
jgi:hypothetical protein